MHKRAVSPMVYYCILAVVYLLFGAILPASAATQHIYHLSTAEYHLLLFSIQLPLVLFWLPAFFGYTKLSQYATLVKKSAEGPPYVSIARGLGWLAWGLVIPSLASLFLNAIANGHPGFHATSLIITGYLTLLFPLVAFNLIGNGTRALAHRAKIQVEVSGAKILLLLIVALSVVFCFSVFRHIDISHLGNALNPYYLPSWLVIFSLIIPYLFAWWMGLLAAYEMLLLSRHTQGLLYRQALQYMSVGLIGVILSLGTLEYFRSVVPRSGHLAISTLLVLVYVAEIISTAGFILISYGAAKLKKIEEV